MILRLPTRPSTAHKGTFGTVALLGGQLGDDKVMLGSIALSAKASIRSGVGMVVFLGPKGLTTELIELVPQAVGLSEKVISEESAKWRAIIIGPGLGVDEGNLPVINELLALGSPIVIDADGLNTLAKYPDLAEQLHDQCVLTPHPKEFERLASAFGVSSPKGLAKKLGCVVVAKGSATAVTDGKASWALEKGNPVLATAGSGDVLAGLIGGLLAQYATSELSIYECAILGVTIHNQTAALWRDRHGSGGLLMDELLELVPEVMDKLRQ